jgi:subtilisin family serine protease
MMRAVAAVLAVGLAVWAAPAAASARPLPQDAPRAASIAPALARQLAAAAPAQLVDVIVQLNSQADLSGLPIGRRAERLSAVTRTLRSHAAHAQRGLLQLVGQRRASRLVADTEPLWISNAVRLRAVPSVITELAARPEVREIRPNVVITAPGPNRAGALAEPNLTRVNAPALWDQGYRGRGIVVANLDTGVDGTHPDLAARWRGGTNSWYDPSGQHPATPTDVNGHGTLTMGIMVGGDAGGSAIGVAPDARWIAAKIFDDRGRSSAARIHRSFQWLLDPDGDPATPDAPHVVSNSWNLSSGGCNLEFQPDLQSLRAAGILPVFSVGNDGPLAGSVASPANNPAAFAVGGSDNDDGLDPYSSRGPSPCAGSVAPAITAPGVDVRSSDTGGGYAVATGTSLSAPHAAGALALLLSACGALSAGRQQAALEHGARDLGPPGLDAGSGHGRLDVAAAYEWLLSAQDQPWLRTVTPGTPDSTWNCAAFRIAEDAAVTLSTTRPPGCRDRRSWAAGRRRT